MSAYLYVAWRFRCVDPNLAVALKLVDRFCKMFVKLFLKCWKSTLFLAQALNLPNCLIVFISQYPGNIFWRPNIKIWVRDANYTSQWLFGHTNIRNRFRKWGWAAFERKGLFISLISFERCPASTFRADFYELCTEISRLAPSCALEARIGK